ncbi:hypothetical protein TeGR_g12714 [Tetraparma gracilis]|uniref:Protein kinase domain-containing protein n=1 Tax=Tetraparma gracilis TaxID=2962635 RepID=A0ABQ6M845_9STRA|nr:hypothetical protein TeGR_g12714 [Tetraparma gracilis]
MRSLKLFGWGLLTLACLATFPFLLHHTTPPPHSPQISNPSHLAPWKSVVQTRSHHHRASPPSTPVVPAAAGKPPTSADADFLLSVPSPPLKKPDPTSGSDLYIGFGRSVGSGFFRASHEAQICNRDSCVPLRRGGQKLIAKTTKVEHGEKAIAHSAAESKMWETVSRRVKEQGKTMAGIDVPVKMFEYEHPHGRAELHVQSKGAGVTFGSWKKLHLFFSTFLEALATLHSAHFSHRDIKPPNLRRSSDGTAILADMGLAVDMGMNALDTSFHIRSFDGHPPRFRTGPPEIHLDVGHTTTTAHPYDMWQSGVLLADYFFFPCMLFPELPKKDEKLAKARRHQEIARRQYRLAGSAEVGGKDVREFFTEDFLRKGGYDRESVVRPPGGGALERVYYELRVESRDSRKCDAKAVESMKLKRRALPDGVELAVAELLLKMLAAEPDERITAAEAKIIWDALPTS